MYVHKDYLHQGIGKCLLDRMLHLINPGYESKGGYEWINHENYLKNGASRIVKCVSFSFLHEQGEVGETEMIWMKDFLKHFQFRKAGHIIGYGYKLGKV